MQTIQIEGRRTGFASTRRVDRWWAEPAATAIGLAFFFGYLTFRAFNATYVWYDPYISPAVAPPLFTPASGYPGSVPVDHAWLGAFPAWWPALLPQTPAFFIPWMAIAFRFTCYYYRGAYYKAFGLTPPSCAVRGVPLRYTGETALLWFQNLHRYTLYGAIFLLACLWWEGFAAFFRGGRFGIGVGTVVMLMNALLLTGYTFGCHSWRHLIGGRLDCFTCDGAVSPGYKLWKGSSWLNERHMLFAWVSLVWVAFTDFYIYLVATGAIRDLNTWQRPLHDRFRFSETNQRVGTSTHDLFAAWFPRFLTPVVRYSIYAMLDDDMIKSFGFPRPLPLTRPLLRGALKLRGWAVGWLPPLGSPHFFTDDRNRTHPDGYEIAKVGPPKLVAAETKRSESAR